MCLRGEMMPRRARENEGTSVSAVSREAGLETFEREPAEIVARTVKRVSAKTAFRRGAGAANVSLWNSQRVVEERD